MSDWDRPGLELAAPVGQESFDPAVVRHARCFAGFWHADVNVARPRRIRDLSVKGDFLRKKRLTYWPVK